MLEIVYLLGDYSGLCFSAVINVAYFSPGGEYFTSAGLFEGMFLHTSVV